MSDKEEGEPRGEEGGGPEKERARKVHELLQEYLVREREAMQDENMEETFDQPKDKSELGKALILPRDQQTKLRWERRCENRVMMADNMYNDGETKTWEEVMTDRKGVTREEDVSIHPEIKMILVSILRTLQEHINVRVPALATYTKKVEKNKDERQKKMSK